MELLGLAIEGCPATAVVAMSTSRVILQDVALTNNNKVAKAENGGALQAESVASVSDGLAAAALIDKESRNYKCNGKAQLCCHMQRERFCQP